MNRPAALISVAALFLAGVAVGALGMHLYYANQQPWRPDWDRDRHTPGAFARAMQEELELTPEQIERIGQIRAEAREQSEAFRREVAPQVRQHMRETHERILEVLTPEQRDRLEEMRKEHRGRVERFFLGEGSHGRRHGPRRGGPPPEPPQP